MKVTLSKFASVGDQTYDVQDRVVAELNGATVEVRQSTDGSCMVVVIDGQVSMEPRKAAIWLVVKAPSEATHVRHAAKK